MLDALRARPEVRWSAAVRDNGVLVDAVEADTVLPTASVGKIFLLVTVAEQIAAGALDPGEVLATAADDEVADSGILQFYNGRRQRVDDLAVLVGAVSDNLATNVLLRRVGLDSVRDTAVRLGAATCGLHDFVRNERGPEHPPFLSTGNAGEWTSLLERLSAGRLLDAAVDAAVGRWLAAGTDLSMVAAAFALDPLAHADEDLGVVLVNKTGTNTGTRADVGFVSGAGRTLTYAVIARWESDSFVARASVLDAMRAAGSALRAELLDG